LSLLAFFAAFEVETFLRLETERTQFIFRPPTM
jgi:hypothetical protein